MGPGEYPADPKTQPISCAGPPSRVMCSQGFLAFRLDSRSWKASHEYILRPAGSLWGDTPSLAMPASLPTPSRLCTHCPGQGNSVLKLRKQLRAFKVVANRTTPSVKKRRHHDK